MRVSTLRPGLLVSLKTSLRGNVKYDTLEIDAEHQTEEGALQARWETTRTVEAPDEHDAAVKARSKARALITGVCSLSSFGLLCPESAQDKLTDAIAAAREVIDTFNKSARVSTAALYVIIGRVEQNDVEAVRAINSEVRELLTSMEDGLRRLDVQAVREAANKAKNLASMLTPEAAKRAEVAIETARAAARRIVKAGETAAVEIDQATLNKIRVARTAFLDLDEPAERQEARTPETTGRAIDLDGWDAIITPKPAQPAFEMN